MSFPKLISGRAVATLKRRWSVLYSKMLGFRSCSGRPSTTGSPAKLSRSPAMEEKSACERRDVYLYGRFSMTVYEQDA